MPTSVTAVPSWCSGTRLAGRRWKARRDVGDVGVHLHDVVHHEDGSFSAVVTYRLGEHDWDQPFTARVVDDRELASLASASSFVLGETLDADGAWIVLRPAGGPGP